MGTYRQTYAYSCGAVAARNLIAGYVETNSYGTVPSENDLMTALGTTREGTAFGSNWPKGINQYITGQYYTVTWGSNYPDWKTAMATKIMYTINNLSSQMVYIDGRYQVKSFVGFNVIADMYYTTSITNPIDPIYKSKAAHYICIYGYDDKVSKYNVVDSNGKAPLQYTAFYQSVADATKERGIIW